MRETKVANRYAASLLELALEQNALENVYQDVTLLAQTISENRNLVLLLKSPIVKTDKKVAVLDELFAGKVGSLVLSFVKLITRKNREKELLNIANSFISQYKKHHNILSAEIISAVPLSDENRKKALEMIKDISEKVELVEKIDPELIGGFILRIGDRQIDTSVSGQLAELKNHFSKNPNIADY